MRLSRCSRSVVSGTGSLCRTVSGRSLVTLAIETSCDDSSVAVLEKHAVESDVQTGGSIATLHFHQKVTADNSKHGGIHPIVALESHQSNLARLVQEAIEHLPVRRGDVRPDLISVTRGPGMRSNLFTGIDTAKGLALAWNRPIIGVHHMQAHALTPRLVTALALRQEKDGGAALQPAFPYLSLLVSGGHTLLVHTRGLVEHDILASTSDIAVGDAIDKIARTVLPQELLRRAGTAPYGRLLEEFAFGAQAGPYTYEAPATRGLEIAPRSNPYGWSLSSPLSSVRGGSKAKAMQYTFSGTDSACRRAMRGDHVSIDERRELAREAMRVMFEHLASRVVFALQDMAGEFSEVRLPIKYLVVSGGVASNMFLRHVLRKYLDVRGFATVDLSFPPIELCTDNAAMIGWTGIEMYEAGHHTSLAFQALRKWCLDEKGPESGVLGPDCWLRR